MARRLIAAFVMVLACGACSSSVKVEQRQGYCVERYASRVAGVKFDDEQSRVACPKRGR